MPMKSAFFPSARTKNCTQNSRKTKFKFRTFFSGLYTILASGVTGAAGKN
jgi:hypothetical protein